MSPATLEDFRARHSRAITRLYTLARGRRWGLAETDFGIALHRSQAAHFRTSSSVGRREVDRYLESLELTDLALATACRRDIPHAWQSLHADYLPVLHEAARATLRDPEGSHRAAERLISELHGKDGEILDQYHGRSRLKTWLRALVARLHDAEIRSPGRIALDDAIAESWFAAFGDALAALEPFDRLRLALYALERLPLASITTLTGETKARTARRLRTAAAGLRPDVLRRLAQESTLDRRELRRLEKEAVGALPTGERRTPIEAFIAVALDRRLNEPGRQCPPPATLAALVEGRLGEAERTAAILHASSCRGCVRQIGTLCRLERPGLAADELRLGRAASPERTLVLVAFALGIGAAVLLVALRAPAVEDLLGTLRWPWRETATEEAAARLSDRATAMAERAPPPTRSDRTTSAPATPSAPETVPTGEAAALSELIDPPIAPAGATPSSTMPPEPAAIAASAAANVPSPTVTTRPPHTPTAAPSPTSRPTASPTTPPTATPTVTPPPLPTPPPTVVPARFPGDQPGATATVLSPRNRSVRWWIAAKGAIALTRDGARSWQTLRSGVDADLLAGAATSDRAAWFVGREGTVLRTTDGTSLGRVRSPTRDDVVAVSARDAQSATITTSRGERFATDDGGATWRGL